MIRRSIASMLAAGTLLAALTAVAQSPRAYSPVTDARLTQPEPRNWLMYRRTYDSWGYSPLGRITTRNVGNLVPVWTASTGTTEGHQSPPIVNDGVMFITTPFNQVFAYDAKTGELLWRASLGGQINSAPMSFAVDGRQYVAIAAGNALFTFALPQP